MITCISWGIFGATLIGISLSSRHLLKITLSGFVGLCLLTLWQTPWTFIPHLSQGFPALLNLAGLMIGFECLAHFVSESKLSQKLPRYLPHNWLGPLGLLLITALLASLIDHIAAALIGGTIARVIFRNKIHIGYIAALVAASNAGGAGSAIGNITTAMIWLSGVPALTLLKAYLGSFAAFTIFGPIAAIQQHRYHAIVPHETSDAPIQIAPIGACLLTITGALWGNLWLHCPALGIWISILLSLTFTSLPLATLKKALPATLFLSLLVTMTTLLPLSTLPHPSTLFTFVLGLISAGVDNIPLTKIAIIQGGYNWPLVSYAVGFGGSLIWFGSAAGVAICTLFPHAKSAKAWITKAWYLPIAYGVGFLVLRLFN